MHSPLLIVALITTALVALANPWEQALDAHLGASYQDQQSHQLGAELAVKLQVSGFHRSLQYTLGLACCHNSWNCSQGLGNGIGGEQQCQAAILQQLPAAVYANIYELNNAAALGQGPTARLFGPVDVESIEQFSKPTVLAIYLNLSLPSTKARARGGPAATTKPPVGVEAAGGCTLAFTTIPLHARYPRPVWVSSGPEAAHAAGVGGEGSKASAEGQVEKQAVARQTSSILISAALHRLAELAAGPVVEVMIPQPSLLLRCGDDGLTLPAAGSGEQGCDNQQGDACSRGASSSTSSGSWRQIKLFDDKQQPSTLWEIPTGNLSQANWVGHVTIAAVLCGALLVALSALRTDPGATWC